MRQFSLLLQNLILSQLRRCSLSDVTIPPASLRRRQKLLRIFFLRVVVDFVDGTLLHDPALFHDKHPVTKLVDDVEIVRDKEIAQVQFLMLTLCLCPPESSEGLA